MTRPDESTMPCKFCESAEDVTSCSWPVERFEVQQLRHLRIGDKITRFVEKRNRDAAVVTDVVDFPSHSIRTVEILINGKRTKRFTDSIYQRVRVLRKCACAVSTCFRHSREVADGRHYCAEHWTAWECAV